MFDPLSFGLASNREGLISKSCVSLYCGCTFKNWIYSLNFSYVHIIYFGHIYSLFFPFNSPQNLHHISTLNFMSFFYNSFIYFLTHCDQLVLPTCTWAWTHSLGHGQPSIGHTCKEKGFLLLQHVSTANSSPPFSRLDLTGLILSTFCICNHGCCVMYI